MVFKELEIQGFKSFPDKVKIRFDEGVTGVVGPNGSGKSNLSDAVRWVLGETSTRQLRAAGKMEDVIFGGTQERQSALWDDDLMPVAVYDPAESIDIDAPIGKGSAFLQAAQRLPILRKFNIICKFEVSSHFRNDK